MKRLVLAAVSVALMAVTATTALAQSDQARVRVLHASPDAPAVDILVDDNRALTGIPFPEITEYAALGAGSHNVKVVPAGATSPVVIDANPDLAAGMAYTVAAAGNLASIEPVILPDDSGMPAEGKAHVRFVHLSPDAPAVDIAVAGGPVLFSNIPFKGTGAYTPVDAGTYDLEARPAGTNTAALSVPGVTLREGGVYTVYAVGLAGGQPALQAILSQDAIMGMPSALPNTGEASSPTTILLMAGLLAIATGTLVLRRRTA